MGMKLMVALCVMAVECQALIPLDGSDCIYLGTWGLWSVLSTAVFVTWSGTRVTGPLLIYHDEIGVDPGPAYDIGDSNSDGALVCTSATRPIAGWRVADHDFFNDVSGSISTTRLNQIRAPASDPTVARLSRDNGAVSSSDPDQNGLWACRVNNLPHETPLGGQAHVAANIVFVGIYRRGMGKCMYNVVVFWTAVLSLYVSGHIPCCTE
jgi:hypothetical protein